VALTYTDALHSLFGTKPFTAGEFSRRTGNPRAAKVLSELKQRGMVERLERGKYRCLRPDERPDLRLAEWNRVRSTVLAGPGPKAWTGATAVEVWTGGRYRLAPSLYARVFELAIPRTREAAWIRYLSNQRVSTSPGKRVGARVRLVPVPKLQSVSMGGEPVVPRHEVERLIREHPGLFATATEVLLD
jgi:hypothetical protein